jgi:hypothetical protein
VYLQYHDEPLLTSDGKSVWQYASDGPIETDAVMRMYWFKQGIEIKDIVEAQAPPEMIDILLDAETSEDTKEDRKRRRHFEDIQQDNTPAAIEEFNQAIRSTAEALNKGLALPSFEEVNPLARPHIIGQIEALTRQVEMMLESIHEAADMITNSVAQASESSLSTGGQVPNSHSSPRQ